MLNWFHRNKKQPAEIIIINETVIEIEGHHFHKHRPYLGLSTIINNQTYIMADISLVLGGTPPTGVFTLFDAKNSSVVPATFTNQAVGANSNPEFATFALDANNNVIPTAIAAGTGTLVLTASASYNDPGDNSAQSGDFSVTKNFTVTASKDGVTLDVVFS